MRSQEYLHSFRFAPSDRLPINSFSRARRGMDGWNRGPLQCFGTRKVATRMKLLNFFFFLRTDLFRLLEGLDVDPPTFSLKVAAGNKHFIVLGSKHEKDWTQDDRTPKIQEKGNENTDAPTEKENVQPKEFSSSAGKVGKPINYDKWNSWKVSFSQQSLTAPA